MARAGGVWGLAMAYSPHLLFEIAFFVLLVALAMQENAANRMVLAFGSGVCGLATIMFYGFEMKWRAGLRR